MRQHRREGKKKRTARWILAAVLAALVLVLALNWKLVRILVCNWISPTLELAEDTWDGGESYIQLAYSDISDSDYLNLYVPDVTEGGEEVVSPPLLILVHGGGFITNDNESRQARFMYQYFRQHGFAVASINYRLSTEAAWPAAISDVKAAVRFLRANAEKYGYDPENFTIWGESAGGYLASMAAVTTDEEFSDVKFIGEDEAGDVSGAIQLLIDFYGACEFQNEASDLKADGVPTWVNRLANSWMTKYITEAGYDTIHEYWLRKHYSEMTEEEITLTEVPYYISKNVGGADCALTDVLIHHGDADMSVSVRQSERKVAEYSEKLGTDHVRLKIYSGYKHADDRLYTDDELASISDWILARRGS